MHLIMININVKIIVGPRVGIHILAEPTSVNPRAIAPVRGVVISEDILAQWIEQDLRQRILAAVEEAQK